MLNVELRIMLNLGKWVNFPFSVFHFPFSIFHFPLWRPVSGAIRWRQTFMFGNWEIVCKAGYFKSWTMAQTDADTTKSETPSPILFLWIGVMAVLNLTNESQHLYFKGSFVSFLSA